jgi:GTP-binding protein
MRILSAEFAAACHVPGRYPPPTLPEIAFAGRSNVGKSSLINALLGRKGLARTSGTPGRTQAVQFYRVNDRFFFVDLPGYGYAKAPEALRRAWGPLVEGYLTRRASLRAVVLILDARRDLTEGDRELAAFLAHHGIDCIPVLTKADKLSRAQRSRQADAIARELAETGMRPAGTRLRPPEPPDSASSRPRALPAPPILFSAVNGEGREAIWRALRDRLAS